ncbi:hypothetical protein [Romboutsia ilealis]|uniref:hypothetical protein n=1 Tax=Romboutsia ilealis TaxID=1115758 RepID=UPI00272D9A6C|nr:hypothetical protein [Romboutsia ilealis]
MLYTDLNNALLSKEKGYILKLKYERFMQVNFSKLNLSAIILSDHIDFELKNTDDSILISDVIGNVRKTNEILLRDMKPEEFHMCSIENKNHMVIIKPLTEQILVDGLIFIENRNTALAILSNFADTNPINVTIPFPEDTMNEFLEFIKNHGKLVKKISLGEMEYFNNEGMPVLARGLYVEVVYDIFAVLEAEKLKALRETTNQKIVERKYETVEKIKNLGKDSNLISDDELGDILEEYAQYTQDNEYYYDYNDWSYRNGKYSRREHDEAYEDLYKELSEHVRDGNIDFIYDPRHRHAITERLHELR